MITRMLVTCAAALIVIPVSAQMADCPMHAEHMAPSVDARHDTLGVSHETTYHTFRLFDDGAAIELHANALADQPTVDAVRKHIQTIADQFKANDFSTPMFVHATKTPAGVDSIKQLHDRIDFRYESLADGARIHMVTRDADAIAALHKFMHFQIIEHRTGDSGVIERDAK